MAVEERRLLSRGRLGLRRRGGKLSQAFIIVLVCLLGVVLLALGALGVIGPFDHILEGALACWLFAWMLTKVTFGGPKGVVYR
jgi:hypothetical protein